MNANRPLLRKITATLFFLAMLGMHSATVLAQGTAFTYQGRLNACGSSANGNYDLVFSLYATNNGGTSIAGPVTNTATGVTNGLFIATIDFGINAFTGSSNWLDIAVRTNGASSFTELTPRQQLTPTPYAIFAEGASAAGLAGTIKTTVLPGFQGPNYSTIGGGTQNAANGMVATVGGGVSNNASGNYAVIGGGQQNTNTSQSGTVAGGQQNIANGQYQSSIGGGYNNTNSASYAVIGGGYQNNNSGEVATIAGGVQNNATAPGAFIGGGGYDGNSLGGNTASGQVSVIGGGLDNTNSGYASVVAGGINNYIQPFSAAAVIGGGQNNTTLNSWAVIGGGNNNTNQGDAGTIAGGQNNSTGFGFQPTVGGGYGNTAYGPYSTVPGGYSNAASGIYSFAAGYQAKANHQGAFVWADSQNAPFSSTANDEFLVRAQGGVGINMNNPNGASLYVQGNRTNGWPNSMSWFENTNSGTNDSPALRVVADGSAPAGALSVSTQGGGLIAQFGNGSAFVSQLDVNGNWTAASFSGNGNGLTSLNAPNLTGPIPSASLTSVPAASLTGAGTLPASVLPASVVTNTETGVTLSGTFNGTHNGNGGGLTNLNASQLASGVIPYGVMPNFQASSNYASIGGGTQNTASGADSTVSGGTGNHATNDFASIGGGQNNVAGGMYATVPGGAANIASGKFSFAAGQQAQATNQGTWVWADSQNAAFASTNNDSFNIRAKGGARFVTSGAGLSVDAQPVFTGSNGAGLTNLNAIALNGLAASNYWQLGGNTVSSNQFLGSLNNQPMVFMANNQPALRLENAAFPVFYLGFNIGLEESVNVVGGYASNYVAPGIIGGTICGGGNVTPQPVLGPAFYPNRVLGNYASVLGGAGNTASGGNSVVMGSLSTAAGFCSVSLGNQTDANSDFSFAAGNAAQATNIGAFVWADSQGAAFASTNTNSFNVRANGGVFFVTSGAGMTLDGPLVVTGPGSDTSYNAAFGAGALQKNTSGQENSAIGVNALGSNTIGSFNAAFGAAALNYNISGNANTAVGTQTMFNNTSGSDNTATGDGALNSNTSGSYNTACGTSALLALVVGSNNIAVGSLAGSNLSSNESNNIDIGSPGVKGESNTIRLGTPGIQTSAYIAGTTTVSNSGAVVSLNVVGTRTGGQQNPVALFENKSTASGSSPALRVVTDGGNPNDGALSVSANVAAGTPNALIAEFGNNNSFVLVITNDGSLYSAGDVYARGTKLTSDRNAKENFTPLNQRTVLEKVAALPVSEWNYKTDSAHNRHIGPVAQDFHAAFGLDGSDDKHISVVDEGGVALAAIQGLNQKLNEKDAEIAALRREVAAEKELSARMEARFTALENAIKQISRDSTTER